MFSIGDVVCDIEVGEKMTVIKSNGFDNSVKCAFFRSSMLLTKDFDYSVLALHSKYIREKKLQSLIDEESQG